MQDANTVLRIIRELVASKSIMRSTREGPSSSRL